MRFVGNDPLRLRDLTIPRRPDQEIEVVGTSSSAAEALTLLSNEPPAHALAVYLPAHLERLEALREIIDRYPHLNVLVLTDSWAERDFVVEVIRAGAKGCIVADAEPEFLVESMRFVAEGQLLIDPRLVRDLWVGCPSRESLGLPPLWVD